MLTLSAGRRSEHVVLALVCFIEFEGIQKNESSSFLPGDAESMKALEAIQQLPGGELAPTVVASRSSTRIVPDWSRRAGTGRQRGRGGRADRPARAARRERRRHVRDRGPGDRRPGGWSSDGLEVKLTGAAGYSLDAIKVFGGVKRPLLLAVAIIVLVLLTAIYRSPIFWAIPFFSVVLAEAASRGAGYVLGEAGITINGQTASCPCWCSARARTTRCCSCPATARSCAATRTSTRRSRSR